ncbi:MAG: glycosyltransferase [Bacteroidales bacterium]|nr:glycosyltransferase [Bacteroidales bacterium]
MRILHINKYQTGGAALCALRISNALQTLGVNTCIITSKGENTKYINVIPEDKYNWSKFKFIRFIQRNKYIIKPEKNRYFKIKISKVLKKEKYPIFTTLSSNNYKDLINHPWIKEADIIHLHWIGNFIDFPSFFINIKKPIVWTLHDLNPLLGCFHYLDSNQKASSQLLTIEKECINIKRKALSNNGNINVVAISKQMQKAINANKTLGKYPITLINNGVDTRKYIPYDKKTSRKKLNIPNEMIVFMFSSSFLDDTRKGLKELINALEEAKIRNIFLLCIGNYREIPKTTFSIRCTGYISDENLLSQYYSAADYFVMPSFKEAFAQTPIEAMSCGTPVIAFPCSGTDDLINEHNGVICNDFTVDALIEGIKLALKRKYDSNTIRKYIEDNFSYDIIAQKYIDLYKRILAKNGLNESKEPFSELDAEFIKHQKQQNEEVKKSNDFLDYLDQRREFYKMVLTHPRYIAGWIKRKIIKSK